MKQPWIRGVSCELTGGLGEASLGKLGRFLCFYTTTLSTYLWSWSFWKKCHSNILIGTLWFRYKNHRQEQNGERSVHSESEHFTNLNLRTCLQINNAKRAAIFSTKALWEVITNQVLLSCHQSFCRQDFCFSNSLSKNKTLFSCITECIYISNHAAPL